MAFSQGEVVTGGYRSCPAVQCGATVTTALTAPTSLFVALIRTYTQVHSDVFRLRLVHVPTCSLSPAVGKVSKPRRGHPLVESAIVGKIRGLSKTSRTLVHARAFTHALKGRPREMRTVNLV